MDNKKINYNMSDAPKLIKSIIVETIVVSILSMILVFIPMDGFNTFEFIELIAEGWLELSSGYVIIRLLYTILTVALSVFSICKVLFTKDKCRLDINSPAEVTRSPFFLISSFAPMRCTLLIMIHLAYTMYHMFTNTYDIDLAVVIYGFGVCLISEIVVIVCSIVGKARPASKYLTDLTMSFYAENRSAIVREQKAISYASQKDDLEALVKYKKLYDSGAITEEEYNSKKSELLNK